MRIITIYTLYGRRAGAELCFEKTIESVYQKDSTIEWIVLCNQSAYDLLQKDYPYTTPIYVKWLDNQYKKAIWLEFMSKMTIEGFDADCFWIPSGCNHFPGRWGIPVVSTFHDLGEYHVANKYSHARMFYRKKICIPLNLKRASRFTTVSEFTKGDMVKFLGVDGKRIKVVYNGSTPHTIDKPNNASAIIRALGLKGGAYFFTPGRTDYIGKGLDILLKAFRAFALSKENISLVFVGPQGEGHKQFINDIEGGIFRERVHYLGRVDDQTLVALYSLSLATVIASRFEGFGFPVLEAMKYKIPIICSDAGALKEVAGEAAIIFKSGDSSELTDKMFYVCHADQTEIIDLKLKGEERLKYFSWDICAEQMIAEFKTARQHKVSEKAQLPKY